MMTKIRMCTVVGVSDGDDNIVSDVYGSWWWWYSDVDDDIVMMMMI